MKTLIGFVAAVVFFGVSAMAWEFPRNPDRFPSIGFNAIDMELEGDRIDIDQPTLATTRTQSGPLTQSLYMIGADVRLPLNDQITLTLAADSVSGDSSFSRGGNTFKEDSRVKGHRLGVGLRLYFSK